MYYQFPLLRPPSQPLVVGDPCQYPRLSLKVPFRGDRHPLHSEPSHAQNPQQMACSPLIRAERGYVSVLNRTEFLLL